MPFAASYLAYWILTGAALVWCLAGGQRPERLAAGVVFAAFVGTQIMTPFELYEWRAGVAAIDVLALVTLVALSVRFDRWWLIFAAGAQLVTVFTHLLALTAPHLMLRTNVEVRWLLGIMLLTLLAIAPFEARRLATMAARS